MDEYVLKEDILKYLEKKSSIEISNNSVIGKDISRAIDVLYCDIDNMTSADVQPVKYGRWICEFYNDVFDVYQADCSVCKKESTDKYDKVSESYEYCPHCGAKMIEVGNKNYTL